MPSSWEDYKGLQLPTPDPTGDAGSKLKENFVVLADRGISNEATLGSVPFVGGTSEIPILDEDPDNFHWDDSNKRLGIGTDSPATELDVDGIITLGQPTSTLANPAAGKAVIYVHNNSGTLELRVKFPNGVSKLLANDT